MNHLERTSEREEDRIMQALADGELTNKEANREMDELRRHFEDAVAREAEQARDDLLRDYGVWR